MADKNANIKERTIEDEMRERIQLNKSKTEFGNKMNEIWKLIIDMRKKNTEKDLNENSLFRVLCSFYEMGLKMQDAINTMTAIQTALQCVTTAIDVMDEVIKVFDSSFININQRNPGRFARFKVRRQMKKAQKGIERRLNVITIRMTGMSEMADSITESMDKAFRKMDGRASKNNKKHSKKSTNEKSDLSNNFPRTERLIEEYMKANGIEDISSSNTGSDTRGWDDPN